MKSKIINLFRKFNIVVFRDKNIYVQEYLYKPFMIMDIFSPWETDKVFLELYENIKGFSLVNKYKKFEIYKLANQMSKKFPNANMCEVGVWRGGTGALMANRMKANNSNGKVFLADTFEGVVNAGPKDPTYFGGEHADTTLDTVINLFKKMNIENKYFEILQGIFPNSVKDVSTLGELSMIHLDLDVYQSTKDSLEFLWKNLVVGGVIVFDDYGFKTTNGVLKYVEEIAQDKDKLFVYNQNGHALIIKIK
jgi:hypothetical protein